MRLFPLLLLLACQADKSEDVDVVEPIDSEDTVVDTEVDPVEPDVAPVWSLSPTLTQNDVAWVPMAAVLSFGTDVEVQASIVATSGEHSFTHTYPGRGTSFTEPVVGFRADRTYEVVLTVEADNGMTLSSESMSYQSPPLPEDFPEITVVSEPSRMSPGVTLLGLTAYVDRASVTTMAPMVAIDAEGEPVWYYLHDGRFQDLRQLANGNMLFLEPGGNGDMREVDILGHTVNHWTPLGPTPAGAPLPADWPPAGTIGVESDGIHHEAWQAENGNFVFLGFDTRTLPDYPTSETDPSAPTEEAKVIADEIVEMAPDGTVLYRLSLHDVLDSYRLGYGALGGFYNRLYEEVHTSTRDWTHANALVVDPSDGAWIVSARHQDAVVKITRDGELVWILGTHDNWEAPWSDALLTPVGDLEWQFHQHAPMVTGPDRVLLFDNGNYRVSPPEDRPPVSAMYSRAVEYQIDPVNMTVEEVWVYGGTGPEQDWFYSSYICDADLLPADTVLITDGGRVVDDNGDTWDDVGAGHHFVRLLEVTHDDQQDVVFDALIGSVDPTTRFGWASYRSERIESLYPQ